MTSIGIDLGTTNCCVADIHQGKVRILENEHGSRVTPSVISFKLDGDKMFGVKALRHQMKYFYTTFFDIKRIIGRTIRDTSVRQFITTVQYMITSKTEQNTILLGVGTKELKSPEEISGLLLAHLKQQCEQRLNKQIENVVITVPTHFNNSQRSATIKAGKIAGFKKVQLLNEPTAAALEYGISNNITDGRVILVYDFGGGTFDVSIIKYNQNQYEVLAVDGDQNLGGRDIDNKLFEVLSKRYNLNFENNDKDTRRKIRFINICNNIKINLIATHEYFAEMYDMGLPDDELVLTRSDFDNIIQPLLNKTMRCVDNCLAQDKVQNIKIDDILLVGGSSRILKVKSMLKEKFGIEPKQNLNPDESVAAGAAIYAAKLYDNQFKDLVFVDVCPFALGVETDGCKMSVIIPKHSPLPATNSKLYKTAEDNQTTIQVKIYYGNEEKTKDNTYLGLLEVSDIALGRKGRSLRETFNVDVNGILSVTAEDEAGHKHHVTFKLDSEN